MSEPEGAAANGSGGPEEAGWTPRHPIGVVAERTGVSVHVLRAWERRYAVVVPQRTETGRRLYSDADVQRLRLLRELTERGRTIGQVAPLSTVALRRLQNEDEAERAAAVARGPVLHEGQPVRESAAAVRSGATEASTSGEPPFGRKGPDPSLAAAALAEMTVHAAVEAGGRMDANRLSMVLTRAVVSLRPSEFISMVAVPLLEAVGRAWQEGRLHPAEEHLVSTVLRRVLGWLLDATEPAAGAPVLLATTTAGERHEFGALLAAAIAVDEGWRVVYPGPDLPGVEIARAARRVGASLVALSVVFGGRAQFESELRDLREALGPDVPVVVGGAAAVRGRAAIAAAGAELQTDLAGWRQALRTRARQVTG
jgi:MerR family transcriptional regulator, light-induced transcriptional regulator